MTNKAFKIEMLVTSQLSQPELEQELLNALGYLENKKVLAKGLSWFRIAEEKSN